MRAFSRALDRFCTKHRKFGIPRLMRYMVFASAVVYIISLMDRTGQFTLLLYFHPERISNGEVWRLVTWVFLPLNDNPIFTAIMLYFYYFIGSSLEREWGCAKFTIYYIFGVVLNIICGFVVWFAFIGTVNIQLLSSIWLYIFRLVPNYLNLSLFFALAALFPNLRLMLFFFIPIKIKWLALANAAYFLFSIVIEAINGRFGAAFLPVVAILNFILICGGDVLNHLRPLKARTSPQTISFKKAARQARRSQDNMQYRHKCEVCSRTEVDSPGLEFRYCSRCDGYHCFCIDHINNHVHFRQN